jgi:hypothetical protein
VLRRDTIAGDWRRLHSEELHNLHFMPSIIRAFEPRGIRWAGHVARQGKLRSLYRIPVEKGEGKRQIGRPTLG